MVYETFTLLNNQPESTRFRSRALYDEDLYAWALEQAALIEAGRFSELDVVNLADEVADVARREVHQLESRLSRVLQHLLKWDCQKQRRGASWARAIREQRRRVSRLLKDSPSLTNRVDDLFKRLTRRAVSPRSTSRIFQTTLFPRLIRTPGTKS